MGEKNYLRILATEYQLQRFETYLPTSEKIFDSFEQKFFRFIGLLDYLPFYVELFIKGMRMFAEDGYSAVEMRLVVFGRFKDKDFNHASDEEFIELLVRIAKEVKQKYGIGKVEATKLFMRVW